MIMPSHWRLGDPVMRRSVLLTVRQRWEERMRAKGLLAVPEGPTSLHPHRCVFMHPKTACGLA